MSATTFPGGTFEPALAHTEATDRRALQGLGAGITFGEAVWREYRLEALNAGLSTSQASEYASALSPNVGLVAGSSTEAPLGRNWFYQSRRCVVNRTLASGLIALRRYEVSKTLGRTERWAEPVFAPSFRPWNVAGGKN
jgi:hypothetical protein